MLDEFPLQSVRDRILMLRSLPAFSPLDDEALMLIAEHSRRRLFRAGETLCNEGTPLSHGYLVLSGQVTSSRKGHRTVVTRAHGVGVLSILAHDPNGIQAVADQDTLTIEIPASAMTEALDLSFPMLRNFLRLTAAGLLRRRGRLPVPPGYAPPAQLGEYPARPATVVEHLLALRAGAGLFASANIDAMLDISRATSEMRLEPGQLLWNAAESSTWWVRIGYGEIRCTSTDGRYVDVGRKYIIGLMDCYAQEPRSYDARTKTRVVLYRTELEDGLAALENHGALARGFVASLAMQVLETPNGG